MAEDVVAPAQVKAWSRFEYFRTEDITICDILAISSPTSFCFSKTEEPGAKRNTPGQALRCRCGSGQSSPRARARIPSPSQEEGFSSRGGHERRRSTTGRLPLASATILVAHAAENIASMEISTSFFWTTFDASRISISRG